MSNSLYFCEVFCCATETCVVLTVCRPPPLEGTRAPCAGHLGNLEVEGFCCCCSQQGGASEAAAAEPGDNSGSFVLLPAGPPPCLHSSPEFKLNGGDCASGRFLFFPVAY